MLTLFMPDTSQELGQNTTSQHSPSALMGPSTLTWKLASRFRNRVTLGIIQDSVQSYVLSYSSTDSFSIPEFTTLHLTGLSHDEISKTSTDKRKKNHSHVPSLRPPLMKRIVICLITNFLLKPHHTSPSEQPAVFHFQHPYLVPIDPNTVFGP